MRLEQQRPNSVDNDCSIGPDGQKVIQHVPHDRSARCVGRWS